MSDDDIRRDLEDLADRTAPTARGAAEVWRGATTASIPRHRRPALVGGAIAAAILAVVGTLAIVNRDGGSTDLDTAAGSRTTRTNPESVVVDTATTTTTAGPVAPAATTPASATTPPTLPRAVLAATRLRPYRSCGDYVATSKAKAVELAGPYGVPGLGAGGFAPGGGVAVDDGSAPPVAGQPSPALPRTGEATDTAAPDFSGTNVQEVGVDEPDTVKTDGRRILALAQGKLWYVVLDGTTPRVAGTLALDNAWGNELLLAGDRAIVVQTQTVYPLARPVPGGGGIATDAVYPYPIQEKSSLAIIDVSSPAMKLLKTITVDGVYVSARMVDDIARIVVRSSPQNFAWAYPQDPSPQAQAQATEQNREIARRSTDANWLPTLAVGDSAGNATSSRPLVACDAALHPQSFAGFGMLTVLTVDPTKPDAPDAATIQADGQQVYASRGSLYVATTAWDRTVPTPEGGPAGVIQMPETLIHKFSIDDPGRAAYLVSGRVRGTVLNQFSFSEHNGRLRVATTDFGVNGSGQDGQSFVSVLDDTGAALVQVGQVGGLGKGERIYAVRFLGDLGYVVTFRQVDPLYVIDLADVTKPRVAGELKILGYSSYLHPIGDGLLLGVGQDASEEGRTLGTQVSVFDVSDPSRPTRLHQVKLGTGQSSAEFDHRAFLWWAKTGLAVIPFSSYDPNSNQTFGGAVGLSASRSGLGEKGRVQHPVDNVHGNFIERSMVIGSLLLTFSQNGVLSSEIADLSPRAFTRFA